MAAGAIARRLSGRDMSDNTRKKLGKQTLEKLRNRLLDKTSRNRLINFPITSKSGLRIIDELPDQLAEVLLADQELRFRPVPEPTRKELIKNGYANGAITLGIVFFVLPVIGGLP